MRVCALLLLVVGCAPARWQVVDPPALPNSPWPEAPREVLLDETVVRVTVSPIGLVLERTRHVQGLVHAASAEPWREVEASEGRVVHVDRSDVAAGAARVEGCRSVLALPDARPGSVVEWRQVERLSDPRWMLTRVPLRGVDPIREVTLTIEAPRDVEVQVDVPEGFQVTPNHDDRGGFVRTMFGWHHGPKAAEANVPVVEVRVTGWRGQPLPRAEAERPPCDAKR